MKILVVSDVSPVRPRGGGERVLGEQARHLARLGHEVRVLSREPEAGTDASVAAAPGVHVSHFPVDRRSSVRFVRSAILGARRAVEAEIAAHPPDVIHLHQPLSGLGALLARGAREVPVLYTFHSPAPLEYRLRRRMTPHHRSGGEGAVITAALWMIERHCLRRAGGVHVLSAFSAGLLWDLYRVPAERVVSIPGGVDLDRFRPGDASAARAALGWPADRLLLLTVRNLEARMGLDTLLHAVARLRSKLPSLLLLIGGTGSRAEALKALARSLGIDEHVRFLGWVPEEQLPIHCQAADAFVLPTRELEGFGLVTVEALACGTPVLGTPVGATPEVLAPLDPSLIFRDPGAEAIADGVRELFARAEREPDWPRRLRQACRDHAARHYAWRGVVAALAHTLERLAAPAPPAAATPPPCEACGAAMEGPGRLYRGARYLRCARCRSLRVAVLPGAAELQHRYEVEYPRAFVPSDIAPRRRALLERLLRRAAARAPARRPLRLLDVGCAGGHLLAAAPGWRGVGTDLSREACAETRRATALPVAQADAAALPFRDAAFDVVTLVNVLDHTATPLAALREAHRVLAPGGVVLVRAPNGPVHAASAVLLSRLGPWVRLRGWDRTPILHVFGFGARGLRRLLRRAGFEVLTARNSDVAGGDALGGHGAAARRAGLTAVGALARMLSGGRWLIGPSLEAIARRTEAP